jgi:ppGpp synthetase/RelA/SpoT-type nucleotidyltranferase
MPPLPRSKQFYTRVGRRILDGAPVDDDLDALNEYIALHQAPMDEVGRLLLDLGYAPTTRLKTRSTLIEKLRRQPDLPLVRVQDVAGARITVSDLQAQDIARDRVCDALTSSGCTIRIRDRRDEPSHGDRAVHVIAGVSDLRVEIQIRTVLQDLWAQLYERCGDIWGRQIRYGGEPSGPAVPQAQPGDTDVHKILRELREFSITRIKAAEQQTQALTGAVAQGATGPLKRLDGSLVGIDDVVAEMNQIDQILVTSLRDLLGQVEALRHLSHPTSGPEDVR